MRYINIKHLCPWTIFFLYKLQFIRAPQLNQLVEQTLQEITAAKVILISLYYGVEYKQFCWLILMISLVISVRDAVGSQWNA